MATVNDEIRLKFFELLSEYKGHPFYFARSILGMHLIYQGQKKIFDSFEGNNVTVVTSGHSTGKSATESALALYWISTRYKARVIVIAPRRRVVGGV